MDAISKSQRRIYEFLRERARDGVPPTVREICAATGLSSTSTVHANLKALEERGLIRRGEGLNRSIYITGAESTAQVPILGRVQAGQPVLAAEEILGNIPVSARGLEASELFALCVRGESMKNAGILEGDYVVVKKDAGIENGDIVVALLGDETTVKRFFREKDHIRLQPENEDFEPILTKNADILGKVISVIRYL